LSYRGNPGTVIAVRDVYAAGKAIDPGEHAKLFGDRVELDTGLPVGGRVLELRPGRGRRRARRRGRSRRHATLITDHAREVVVK
jgi:hypothetical protein